MNIPGWVSAVVRSKTPPYPVPTSWPLTWLPCSSSTVGYHNWHQFTSLQQLYSALMCWSLEQH